MKINSICIIGIYFGKLRNDFPLWLQSCKYNPTIDFLLVTDQSLDEYDVPPNVHAVKSTLEDVTKLASSKLEMKVCIPHPYKLCDFKPAYGLIFADYIKGYEYWGECDFDLMFGDLRSIFTQYSYREYDHFLTQGHLSLYRNTPEVNERYKLSGSKVGDYKRVFTSEKNFAFDENSGIGSIYLNHGFSMFKQNIYADLSPLYQRTRRSTFNKMDVPPKNYHHQVFYWENGKCYCSYAAHGKVKRYEVLYIHYQKRKFQPISDYDSFKTGVYVLPDRFLPKAKLVSKKEIYKLNPYQPICENYRTCVWWFNWFVKRVKARIKKS